MSGAENQGPTWKAIVGITVTFAVVFLGLFGREIFSERREISEEITQLRSRMDRIEVQFEYIDQSLTEIKTLLRKQAGGQSIYSQDNPTQGRQ